MGLAVLLCALLISGFIQATTAQCLNGQSTNCGTFCCPPNTNSFDPGAGFQDSSGNTRDECCRAQFGLVRSGCCSFLENQFSTCDGRMCPDFRTDEARDGNGRLRGQCCKFFRSGCCSTEENDSLQTLFTITVGVSATVALLICLIFPLTLLCCFCTCSPKRDRIF